MEDPRVPLRNATPGAQGDKTPTSSDHSGNPKSPVPSGDELDDAGWVGPITESERARFVIETFQAADDDTTPESPEKPSEEVDEDITKSPFAEPSSEDVKVSAFAEAPKKSAPTIPDKKAADKPVAWQSTAKPTGTTGKPALGRAPTIASVRGKALQPISNAAPSTRVKPSPDQLKSINQSAFQMGGKNLKLVYPHLFDQKRSSKTLTALNEHIEKICGGAKGITTEEASALYKRFCVIELIGESIEFMVPITKAKADAAILWMQPAFTACTQEIARKIKEGAKYRPKDSPELVKKEEMRKLGKEVTIMVWNIWPHQSLLHHRPALNGAIREEVKKQTSASSMNVGLFRESGSADATLVNSALAACAHPFGKLIVNSCTTWFASTTFTAFGTADQDLNNLENSPGKQALVKSLVTVIKLDILKADEHFVRPIRWMVRRFLDAIKDTKLKDADKRMLERQVLAYIFLNAVGGYVTRAGVAMAGFRQLLIVRSWGVVTASLNSAVSGTASKKEQAVQLLDAMKLMGPEFATMFNEFINKIRNDPDLAEL